MKQPQMDLVLQFYAESNVTLSINELEGFIYKAMNKWRQTQTCRFVFQVKMLCMGSVENKCLKF